jgi:hypothetical protein
MHADKQAEKITGTGPDRKAFVAAVLERGRTICAKACSTPQTWIAILRSGECRNVEARSTVNPDALKSYEGLDEFTHKVGDLAITYVDGNTHTNNCETFWSLLKCSVERTDVAVEPLHLFRHIDEQVFRYNNFIITDNLALGLRNAPTGNSPGYKERNNMAERHKSKGVGTGEAERAPLTTEQFEATPEFWKF